MPLQAKQAGRSESACAVAPRRAYAPTYGQAFPKQHARRITRRSFLCIVCSSHRDSPASILSQIVRSPGGTGADMYRRPTTALGKQKTGIVRRDRILRGTLRTREQSRILAGGLRRARSVCDTRRVPRNGPRPLRSAFRSRAHAERFFSTIGFFEAKLLHYRSHRTTATSPKS